VLIPTQQHIRTLTSARLASTSPTSRRSSSPAPTPRQATLITSDVDERDRPFVTGERTAEGFYRVKNGLEPCIARAKFLRAYSDLIWMETGTRIWSWPRSLPRRQSKFPDQMLAYNCSPSFNWRQHLDDSTIAKFQRNSARWASSSSSSRWPASTP